MEQTITKYQYHAFGFKILSEIPLPELISTTFQIKDAEITISKADMSSQWSYLKNNSLHFVADKERFIFQVPHVAVFQVTGGNEIVFSTNPNISDNQVRLYLLGSCMGALLLQRKKLALHGSAVEINGKAYAIIGDSGAGKSTLAAALMQKGYKLLSDDVIALQRYGEAQQTFVTPSYPQQKLWDNSLAAFKMEAYSYPALHNRENKFAVSINDTFSNHPLPLGGIIELTKWDEANNCIIPVPPLERLQILYHHTYRNFLINRMELLDWHFKTTAKLAKEIDLYRLTRTNNYFTAHELASTILNLVTEGEQKND